MEQMILEAVDPSGKEWEVILIRPGTSKNGNYYPPEVLMAAAPLFEGVRAFADHATQEERRSRPERSIRDVVGWFDSIRFAEGDGVLARFHILESADWLRRMVLDAFQAGRADLIGFSIDAEGRTATKRINGTPVRWVEGIERVNSVDVVTRPAAGGQLVRLLASDAKEVRMEDLEERIRRQECRLLLKEALMECDLPHLVKEKIKKRFEGKVFEEAELLEAIRDEREVLARLSQEGAVRGFGKTKVEVGDCEVDRYKKAMDGLFFGSPVDGVRPFRSLQEAFRAITGRDLSDALSESHRLMESLTTASFDQILADSITRRMLKEYSRPDLNSWRQICEVVAISDFRTQRRMRFGGYANLPTVAQGASYAALTSPTDEEATYTPAKRGGTEDLTLEMIKNDDVGAIRRIPIRLGRAAAQTLHEFVFDFLATNPLIYDALALFSAGHNNIGSAALSSASLMAGRNAMMKQTELNSGKRLAIRPRFLVVPIDLEETAFQLINSERVVGSANNEPNFIKALGLNLIVVEYWTDTNNWYLVADPADVPTIEVGFLEGREEPELFVQDQESVGSMFSADKITYKIRHIYGGAVMDYRGFYGAIVV